MDGLTRDEAGKLERYLHRRLEEQVAAILRLRRFEQGGALSYELWRPPDLLALAAKVEAATGPNIALEQEIAMAVYGAEASDVTGITVIDGHIWRVPAYTASLDAAMTLISKPGKWSITASRRGLGSLGLACRGRAPDWHSAATPALALTAACLRARAAMEKANG
ncbi:hypothetical protein AB5I41_01720 [Sphingomonas sp. MMS24-JH45]